MVDKYQTQRLRDGQFTVNERFLIAEVERRSSLQAPSRWLIEALTETFGVKNTSGQAVNEKSAMSIAAVHACVRVISEGLATMPLRLLTRESGLKQQDKTSPAAKLIKEPNPFQTGFQFRKQMVAVAVLKGNSYAYIFRDNAGRPINVMPLQGDVSITPIIQGGQLYYQVSGEKLSGIPDVVGAYDMIHIKGLCLSSSFEGISPIKYHAQTLGIDLAAQNSLAATFKTGSKKFVLSSEKPWAGEQQQSVKNSFEKVINNEANTVTVPSGVKMETLSLTPAEAGFLESHKLTAQDVARIFGVPASMIGADEGASKASVEQDWLNFLNMTLAPWAESVEQELEMKLLSEREKEVKEFKHAFQSLLKADANARAEFYTKLSNIGALNANEIRDLEDMNPAANGDIYTLNVNQIPAAQFEAWIDAKIASLTAQENKNNNPTGNQ